MRNNTRGARARQTALDAETRATYLGLASRAGFGLAVAAQGMTLHPATAAFAHPTSAALTAAAMTALVKQGMALSSAQHGRNRATGLDYLGQRSEAFSRANASFERGGANLRPVDLVRGPVTVRRNGKTFTQMRMVRPER